MVTGHRPIQFAVIMIVVNFPLRGQPILFITRTFTDRIGWTSLPLLIRLFVSACFTSPRSRWCSEWNLMRARANLLFDQSGATLARHKRLLARYDS